jgi:DNA polymerase-3 subunit gamma/tau
MLINKYRPVSLDDFYGNTAVKQIVNNIISKKECSHSYLLTGEAGCGKTTLARILATKLNCLEIKEYNSAFMSKMEDIRDMLNEVLPYTAWGGGNVGIILDECHSYLTRAQGILLKPIEEPPDHIYWFLCTNKPEKLTKAMRSRLTEMVVKPLTFKEMYKFLNYVVLKENVELDVNLYEPIFNASGGIPRFALNILEKILSLPYKEAINVIKQTNVLLEDEDSTVIELCRAIMNNNYFSVQEVLNKLDLDHHEVETARWTMNSYFSAVLLKNKNSNLVKKFRFFTESFEQAGKLGFISACLAAVLEH